MCVGKDWENGRVSSITEGLNLGDHYATCGLLGRTHVTPPDLHWKQTCQLFTMAAIRYSKLPRHQQLSGRRI